MTYTAFPIYDFRSGLQLDKEPWLLPANAFQVAENVYFKGGQIRKRRGYEAFGQTANGGVNVLATPPVMGLHEFKKAIGTSTLLAFDKDFLYEYDPDADDWVGKGGYSGTPDWTGDEDNYFQCITIPVGQLGAATDLVLINNDKENIKVWNGASIVTLAPNGGGSANRPSSAMMCLHYKGRIIAFNTVEDATRYPQRARFSSVDSYSDWTADVFVDAPTDQKIRGAAVIRNEVFVFFEESTFWLRYTGNATLPFVFTLLDAKRGSYAHMSVQSPTGQMAFMLGKTSWNGVDAMRAFRIDTTVPSLTQTLNQESLRYAYGFVDEFLGQYLCSYASLGNTYPDKIFCFNYEDGVVSLYDLAMNVVGTWILVSGFTFDDFAALTFDEADFSFDDIAQTAGYPEIIMGDRSGYTWRLFSTGSDNGSNIIARLKTKRLVPYEGQKSRLGWIDLHGRSGSNLTLTLKVYKNNRTVPHTVKTISMYTANEEKTVQRIRIGEVGRSHTIEIYDDSKNNTWHLDAIVPWFKRAGRL